MGESTIQIMGDDLGYAQEEEIIEDEEIVGARVRCKWHLCPRVPRRHPSDRHHANTPTRHAAH